MQISVGVRGVQVRVPRSVPESEISEFVDRKRSWIDRAVQEAGLSGARSGAVFSSGSIFYVCGEEHCLDVVPPDAGKPWLEELPRGWRIKGDAAEVRKLLVKWYRLKAEKVLRPCVAAWAQQMGMDIPDIVIKEQSRLWGSYSARTRRVNLNWRMAAFPLPISEYIVVHELCHAKYLDHSRAFWSEVARFCPDWQQRRLWLRRSARKYLF